MKPAHFYYKLGIVLLLLFVMVSASARPKGDPTTIKQQMEWLHKTKKINFTYDASLPVGQVYRGPSLKHLPLDKALSTLFAGSGIDYSVKGKYVILSKSQRSAPPRPPKPTDCLPCRHRPPFSHPYR